MSENFKRYLNVYEWETQLPGTGAVIKYKPITTGQIKKLLMFTDSDDDSAIETALDTLIQECVVTEGFDIHKLYLPDRFFILVEIRNATKGNRYSIPTTCLKCGSQTIQNVDLSKLPVSKLKTNSNKLEIKEYVQEKQVKKGALELVEDVKDEAPIKRKLKDVINMEKLPWNYIQLNDNVGITLGLMTREIQLQIESILKDKELTPEKREIEESLLSIALLVENIVTPAGVEKDLTVEDKIYLIENTTPPEKEKIEKWINDNDYGLEFKFKVVCNNCKDEYEREIPLNNFFY